MSSGIVPRVTNCHRAVSDERIPWYQQRSAGVGKGRERDWLTGSHRWRKVQVTVCLGLVLLALALSYCPARAELTGMPEYLLADSEEQYDRRIYSYDFDVDSAGHIHAVYLKPVPGASRCEVVYGNNVSGSWVSRVLESDGKLGSISTTLVIDPVNDTVHLSYIKHQNDPNYGEPFDPTRHTHLAYRTIVAGEPGSERVVERGGWHSRMQLLETSEAVFIREGSSNLRFFKPSGASWSITSLGLPAAPHHRLADFLYDRVRRKYHVTYGDSGQIRDVYAGKGSTTRIPGTFHKLLYATSSDSLTWISSAIDGSYTLYESEFWTTLDIDATGQPFAAMYRYHEDTVKQLYNTGTSLIFGKLSGSSWQTRTIIGGESDSRAGMGVGLALAANGNLYGAWDSSPDFPKDFNGAAGNIALHRSTDAIDWNSYRMQAKPFSAEGRCCLKAKGDRLFLMVLGNHLDTRLYLTAYRIADLPAMPPRAVPRIPTGAFSERWVQFAWDGVANAQEYYLTLTKNGAAFKDIWTGNNTFFWPGIDLPDGTYQWRVQRWVNGEGTWSNLASFTVAASAVTPLQDWPANAITVYRPRFNWSDVPGATAYELRIESNGAIPPQPPLLDLSEWTPPTTLQPGTYYWWVRTANPPSDNWTAGRRFELAPTAFFDPIASLTIDEDAGLRTASLSGITSGAGGSQSLTVTAVSSNTALIPNPTVSYVSPAATGALNFSPVAHAYGTATVTVTLRDVQAVNNTFSRSFVVTVNSVNDPPTTADTTVSISEDVVKTFAVADFPFADPDSGDSIKKVLVVTVPAAGTLIRGGAVLADAGMVFCAGSEITVADITAGRLAFVRALDANGSPYASFRFKVSDGSAYSTGATMTINVLPVNDAPIATADYYRTAVNTQKIVAAPGMLSNDADPDGVPLAAVKVSDPAHGALLFNGNGSFSYTPTTDYRGSDSFNYMVSDGTLHSPVVAVTFEVGAGDGVVIPLVGVEDVTRRTAVVSWTTAGAEVGRVEFKKVTARSWTSTPDDRAPATHHTQLLNDLERNTMYLCRVVTTSATGRETVSLEYGFRTRPPRAAVAGKLVVADFDGNTSPDIAEIGVDGSLWYTTDKQSWLNGTRVLQRIVSGDFNGDGLADLSGIDAAGHVWFTTDLTAWKNIPGVFSEIAVGDFDGDGRDALAGTDASGRLWYAPEMLDWVALPATVTRISVGDFNGDGRDELAGLDATGTLWYTLDLAMWKSFPGTYTGITTGDFDGDGIDEVAGVAPMGLVRSMNGSMVQSKIPARLTTFVTGDLDGDGRDEMIGYGDTGVVMHTVDMTTWTTVPEAMINLFLADINGDNKDELCGHDPTGELRFTTDMMSWSAVAPRTAPARPSE